MISASHAALSHLARQAAMPNGAAIKVEAQQQIGPDDLPPEIASVLYRVAQEALGNAMRHSHALNVRLRVAIDDGHVELSVSMTVLASTSPTRCGAGRGWGCSRCASELRS